MPSAKEVWTRWDKQLKIGGIAAVRHQEHGVTIQGFK